jgi:hypothetical protein
VRESSSPEAAIVDALAFMNLPRACLEATVTRTEVDRNPFDSFEACEAMRARLEAKDREAAASGRASAQGWLDEEIAKVDGEAHKAREELAAFIARTAANGRMKQDRMEQEMRRIEREHLEAHVRNSEQLAALLHVRRDREAKEPVVPALKGACVGPAR